MAISLGCSNERSHKRSRNLKNGFSLIEIMIVILIIGVLAAAAFGGFAYLQRAKATTTDSKLAALDTALETYATRLGEYPTDVRELVEGPSKANLQRKWGEPLIAEDGLKDGWNQEFVYQLNPKGTRPPYDLYSIGSTGNAQIRSPVSREG